MNTSKTNSKAIYLVKFLGLALIIAGIPAAALDISPGSEIPLTVGLFITLVTTDKIEDERSVQIKSAALYISFIVSYAAKLLITNLYEHSIISFNLVEISHFLILTLSLANIIFYSRLFLFKR
jgi:hypothetical protein